MRIRRRHSLEFAARPVHQRPRQRRYCPDHRLGEGSRRPAAAARRRLRRPNHGRPLGDAFLRPRLTSPSSITPPTPRCTSMSAFPDADRTAAVPDQTAAAGRTGHRRQRRRRDRRGPPRRRPLPRHLPAAASTRASPRDHYVEVDLGDDVLDDRAGLPARDAAGSTRPTAPSTSPSSRAATTGRTASFSKCPTAKAAGPSAGRPSASPPARTRRL